MPLDVPHAWIENHLLLGRKMAWLLQKAMKANGCTVAEQLEAAEGRGLWEALARAAGQPENYLVSEETKLFVRAMVEHSESRPCRECSRLAEVDAHPDAERPGNELCRACHRRLFPLAARVA